jgi:hypothetical protein
MPTNDDLHLRQPEQVDADHPGYETSDVNVNGVAVFLAGLFGFVFIFFGVCFLLGQVINNEMAREDGQPNKWHGGPVAKGERQNLASDAELEQKGLQTMTATFPTPRLDIDDGNQATADLHAREDLLLNHYSTIEGGGGAIRIPISRAMELIAQRGLPVNAAAASSVQLAGDAKPEVQAPLTTGFARTGYELDVMESREQKLSYGKAEGGATAEVAAPAK